MKTAEWLKKYGIVLKKSLGQVFLSDQRIAEKIALYVPHDFEVVEVGAGAGTLTEELARRVRKVIAVEIDRRLESLLKERLEPFSNVVIVFEDFLKLDLGEFREHVFVGNLPYHLGTRIIEKVLKETSTQLAIFMLQKEVAQRITARPGSKSYGSFSVFVQSVCDVDVLFHVSPSHFLPNPRVESTVIRLKPVRSLPEDDFERFVRKCFSNRRKKLVNSAGLSEEILKNLGIPSNARAEDLSVKDYKKLFEVVREWRKTSTT